MRGSTARPGGRRSKFKKRRAGNVAVDFTTLQMSSIKKYRNLFQLDVPANATKAEVIEVIRKHWVVGYPRIRPDEVISKFLIKNEVAKKRADE